MLAICNAAKPVAFQSPNSFAYIKKRVLQGKQLGAKTGHRKKPTSSKHHPMSKIEATKSGSSLKESIGSPTGHLKRKKKSSSAKELNPSQPPSSTLVVAGMYKEALQATSGPTSLGVTSESTLGHDALATSTAEADHGISALNDLVYKQQVRFEDDEFNTSPDLSSSDDAKKEIKLEDLSKLVQNVKVNFKDLDSPEHDAPIIIQDEDVEEAYIEEFHDEEVHDKQHTTPKDASASHPPSLKTIRIQEPSTQVHLLQTLNSKLVYEKEVVETKAALLKAKPSFTNVSSAQAKIKTLDALPSLLKKVTEPLNMFAHAIKAYQDKGKEAMSYKENKEEESEIDSEPTVKLTGSMVKSSKTKKLNKFDFVTKKGDHIHLTEEQIKEQKRIEESVKADMAKREEEVGKEELVDLLGIDVVTSVIGHMNLKSIISNMNA
ncbi:hypothetical protein Tco_1175804 [Tanacetum coccineum]